MRLELSRRTDLALRSLRELDRRKERLKRPELATVVGTTPAFLARVMGPLVQKGWVASEVGRSGGYEAAADLGGISMLQLIGVMEGTPDDGRCVLRGSPCDAEHICALHDAWIGARTALMDELARTPIRAANVRG